MLDFGIGRTEHAVFDVQAVKEVLPHYPENSGPKENTIFISMVRVTR
jgi:hypothetical protein